jgi:hypothetical protein
MMDFPNPFTPDEKHRAGRMMSAGRVTVTVTPEDGGEHITILLKSYVDNRDRAYKSDGKNWEACSLAEASHVFCEVPRPSSEWNDKVGTFYPRTGRWFDADSGDPVRIAAAKMVAMWLVDPSYVCATVAYRFQEGDFCGDCGLPLTDPISLEIGRGPTCRGKETGSQHQVKNTGGEVGKMAEIVALTNGPTLELPTGVPTAAENAAVGIVKGMSIDQIELLMEFCETRLAEIRSTGSTPRHAAEEQAPSAVPPHDRDFMAR